jgi:peroxiredoxin
MRKLLSLIPALTLAATMLAQTKAPAPAAKAPAAKQPWQIEHPAGEFVIHMTDGSQKLLSSYRGKVVVMAFMYSTCEHCQHTAGVLAKINTEYAGKGVQILGVIINPGGEKDIPMFLKITGANFPLGFADRDQAIKFLHGPSEGWFIPMLAFIDRNGVVRYENIVTDTDDGTAGRFTQDQEVNIPKEIDKYLKAPKS